MTGRVAYAKTHNLQAGTNAVELNTDNLPAGISICKKQVGTMASLALLSITR